MSVSEELIDRLSTETGRRLKRRAWTGRRRALAAISKICVITTDDGYETREVEFDRPPTLGQLAERVGDRVFVVAVEMRRRRLRDQVRMLVAAE